MNLLRCFFAFFRRSQLDREMAEEMAAHLARETEQNFARGLPPDEARYAARRAFGGLDQFQERERDARGFRWIEDGVRDLRYALRSLRKSPAFTGTTILILALGIGGVTAVFSTVYAVAIRPLPYPKSDRLVLGRATFNGNINPWVSGPDYADYREQSHSFAALEAFFCIPREVTVTDGHTAERLRMLTVTTGLLRTLGVNTVVGRPFADADGQNGAAPVVLVSYSYWRRQFAGATDLTGCTLTIDGFKYAVVGVTPADFHFVYDADILLPVWASDLGPRRFKNWLLVARLREGVTLAFAQSEVDVIAARLERAYPDTDTGEALLLTPLQSALAEQFRTSFLLLCAGAGAVLLIACANAVGLLLARGVGRHGELALRAALGASQGRIVRLLLAEALVLAGGAGAAGAVLAVWLQRGLVSLLPPETLLLRNLAFSRPVLGFVLGVTLAVGFAFGILPARRAQQMDLIRDLRAVGPAGRGLSLRLRRGLVVGQVAISFTLLFAACLLLRSLDALRGTDLGFNPRHLLTAEIPLPRRSYSEANQRFFAALLDNVRGLPGVVAAGAIDQLPLRDPYNNVDIYAAATPPPNPQTGPSGFQRIVLPGYFHSMGIPLLAGRDFAATDTAKSPRVIIISQRLATGLFPHRDPLGQLVVIDRARDTPWEVVGVVGDVKQCNPGEDNNAFGSFYRPHAQAPWSDMRLAIRTADDPRAIVSTLRSVLQRMNPDVALSGPRTMEEVIANTTVSEKAQTLFLTTFAVLALTLAAAGIFGLLTYLVAARRHEIGVRMALGATRSVVALGVLREAAALALAGVLIGGCGAFGVAQLLRASFYQVGAGDPVALSAAALALLAAAALAAWLPALRAARVDPLVALRAE